MGGHTQYGEYPSLQEAVKAEMHYHSKWCNEYFLYLKAVSITWSDEKKVWTLAMRFTK